MDSAKYRGVVGQRKMSSTATRKGSMSRVSPGMWWWYQQICEICNVTLTCSMVDVTSNSHRGSPGSVPRKSQIYSPLLRRNWHVKTMGGGGSRGCAQVASADSCKMRGIVADCSRLKPGASRQPAFMASCQTVSHMWYPCLPSTRWVKALCPMAPYDWARGVLLTFFLTWWVWFYL